MESTESHEPAPEPEVPAPEPEAPAPEPAPSMEIPASSPEQEPEPEMTVPVDAPPEVHTEAFDVMYTCLRCGTPVQNAELARLPEIKCICGFRVFTKMRPPVVKKVRAI